jgi:hypothetical protein
MALFLLENMDFLYTVIKFNLYLMVHSIVLKFEKIWLSHTLNIIRKPSSITVYFTFTVPELWPFFS